MDKTYPKGTTLATKADMDYLVDWCTRNGITVKKLKPKPLSKKKHW